MVLKFISTHQSLHFSFVDTIFDFRWFKNRIYAYLKQNIGSSDKYGCFLTEIRPALAHVILVRYHSIKFGTHIPKRSFFSKCNNLKLAASLSAFCKRSENVTDSFWCVEMMAFLSPNLSAAFSKSRPIVIYCKGCSPMWCI